jgi:hypothetical protein
MKKENNFKGNFSETKCVLEIDVFIDSQLIKYIR